MRAGVQTYKGRDMANNPTGSDGIPGDLDQRAARELLMEASLIISSFRNKVANAGYPFQLPPGTAKIITEIDLLLHPPTSEKVSKQILDKHAA